MKELPELIAGLSAADHKYAFFCLQTLEEESCNSARIYNFLDVFTAMLWSENSYLRTRGFRLIAANAMGQCKQNRSGTGAVPGVPPRCEAHSCTAVP